MKHTTVYGEKGIYAGWPANHGAWQWGDEFLVGFMRGAHKKTGMHNIGEPYQKVLARSLDGGETWNLEIPNVDFEAREAADSTGLEQFAVDYDLIYRFCGRYDHGGEYCMKEGGYYVSPNRGRTWCGPYQVVPEIAKLFHCTTRTCVLDDLFFVSFAEEEHWGTDLVHCLRMQPNGQLGFVGEVLNDDYRAVMPAAAKTFIPVGNKAVERIVVCLRRRGPPRRGGWIDAVHSDDHGLTWSKPVHVADTGVHNGNPPALISRNGVLFCAYANRSSCEIIVSQSLDAGRTWASYTVLRAGECSDIGYPRLLLRKDGQLVCVYYWSDKGEEQRIEATVFK